MTLSEWREYRMCGRKKPFSSRREAKKVARRLNHRVYDCPICGGWHTTSSYVSIGG